MNPARGGILLVLLARTKHGTGCRFKFHGPLLPNVDIRRGLHYDFIKSDMFSWK